MFWKYSWYLQRLNHDSKRKSIVVFAMLWRYSWYLQRLKYDAKHSNIVVFQCSGGIQGTSSASNTMPLGSSRWTIQGDWASPGQNFDARVSFWWVLGIVRTWYHVGNTCCAITTWCYARQCPWRKGGLWKLFSGDNSFPFREICLQKRIQTLHSRNPGWHKMIPDRYVC